MSRTSTSRRTTTLVLVALLGASTTLGACKHYRVTDVSSGSSYYTKSVNHQSDGGVSFRDAETENKVTLQSARVDRITKSEFKDGTRDSDDPVMNNQ
jgi:hypothetical protein